MKSYKFLSLALGISAALTGCGGDSDTIDDIPNVPPFFLSDGDVTVIEGNSKETGYQAEIGDANNDAVILTISGADADEFDFFASGALTFKQVPDAANPTDADGDNVYQVRIDADDRKGGRTSQDVKITVVANNAPAFSSASAVSVTEGNTDPFYTVLAADADGHEITYSLAGADAAQFTFDADSRELAFKSAPDFANPADADGDNDYVVEFTADDGFNGLTTQTVTITVEELQAIKLGVTIGYPTNNANLGGTPSETTISGIIKDINGSAITPADVTSITVNGNAVDASNIEDFGDYVRWSTTVTVSSSPLDLNVVVEPDNATATHKLLNKALETSTTDYEPRDVVYDEANNRLLVMDNRLDALLAIDLTDGSISTISDHDANNDGDTSDEVGTGDPSIGGTSIGGNCNNIAFDSATNLVYLGCTGKDDIIKVDLSNGNREIIATVGSNLDDLVLDKANNRLLVANRGDTTVAAVNLATMAVNRFSANGADGDDIDRHQAIDIDVESKSARAIVADRNGDIYTVNLSSGLRAQVYDSPDSNCPATGGGSDRTSDVKYIGDDKVLTIEDSSGDCATAVYLLDFANDTLEEVTGLNIGTEPTAGAFQRIGVDVKLNRAFITDSGNDTVQVVDLDTGERAVVADLNGLQP